MSEKLRTKELVTYQQLVSIPAGTDNESLIDVRTYDESIVAEYEKPDMVPYVGTTIFVRETIAKKLAQVNALLSKDGYKLRVVYGYRHPEVQQKYFSNMAAKLQEADPTLSGEALKAAVHNFVAVPEVAGHPTGGAIDLTIVRTTGETVDMGTKIADYTDPERIKTYAEGLTEAQIENRAKLLNSMITEDFAPFFGEWWHFSYGDKEWAYFYEKPAALYDSVTFTVNV